MISRASYKESKLWINEDCQCHKFSGPYDGHHKRICNALHKLYSNADIHYWFINDKLLINFKKGVWK